MTDAGCAVSIEIKSMAVAMVIQYNRLVHPIQRQLQVSSLWEPLQLHHCLRCCPFDHHSMFQTALSSTSGQLVRWQNLLIFFCFRRKWTESYLFRFTNDYDRAQFKHHQHNLMSCANSSLWILFFFALNDLDLFEAVRFFETINDWTVCRSW